MAADVAIEDQESAELGRRVRAARARAGMTRRQLALASATSERYLANIEGGTGNPSLSVLAGLAGALGIAPAQLLPQGGERSAHVAEAAELLRRLPDARIEAAIAWMRSAGTEAATKAQRIALTGLRGAGKSSLGAALAARLGVPFVEMSKEIERAYGGEIGLLIELGGQNALRRYEHEAWHSIIDTHRAAVIATAGGVVADAALYGSILESAHSIWLTADPEDHMQRVMAQGDFRPMAANRGAMADLKAILAAREADYARADGRLDTSRASFAETLEALESLARQLLGHIPAQ